MSAIQWLKPLIDHCSYRLEMAIRVLLFPKPLICQGYARQGGHITVTGRPGGGASFNVGLPASRSGAPAELQQVQQGQP